MRRKHPNTGGIYLGVEVDLLWRRRAGSNRCIAVLQTAPLATWVRRPAREGIIVRGWAGRLVEKGEWRLPPIGQDRNLFPGCRGLIGRRFELFPSIV